MSPGPRSRRPDAPGPAPDEFADWDAAYVLGSLTPTDRHRYEDHVTVCPRCAQAVAELAGMPGLLAGVPVSVATADPGSAPAAADPPLPPDLLPRLIRATRRRTRRSRGLVLSSLAVAAGAVLIALLLISSARSPHPVRPTSSSVSGPQLALHLAQLVPNPLTADVTLHGESWGTRIDLKCGYAPEPGIDPAQSRSYTMVVTNRTGGQSEAASWTAGPGTTTEPVGTTAVPFDQIATVEIRSATGTALLRATR